VAARFLAYGWHVQEVDGYDLDGLRKALEAARAEEAAPSLIVARTRIGRYSLLEGSAEVHGAPLGEEAVAKLKADLGWPETPFFVPEAVRQFFEARRDRKSTRLNSSHVKISYAVFCLKRKRK